MRKSLFGLFLLLVFVLVSVGWTMILWQERQSAPVQTLDNKQLIRFHVLANSDSSFDQEIKLKVRDAVISYMQPLFTTAADVQEARKIIVNNREQLLAIAREVLAAEGVEEDVSMQMGMFDFPIKAYGDIVLPAGSYEAVRILIGKGQGKNWWCVLFPPLCFIDQPNATAAFQSALKSEGNLPAPSKEKTPVQIKWKLAELWEEWK